MHHFFVEPSEIISGTVHITGENYRHLRTVLRAELGEHILISDGTGTDYVCELTEITEGELLLRICFRERMHELPAEIHLFQGLPKSDKLELIVQKAVELGAFRIVPLRTQNAVVRLDEKRAGAKVMRWRGIAEAAAKQSKRSIIPEVAAPMDFREAIEQAADFDCRMIPYENAEGMTALLSVLRDLAQPWDSQRAGKKRIAVFIGPEGGFSRGEIEAALAHGVQPVSLGRRILRTETAAITTLSLLMTALELSYEDGQRGIG
ncbi:MAG: 16S rRNA (uracil(1498)-N(3))-methyltransferase [Oribacterium sp.]